MNTYLIEITDTFGGEANYCWVKRYRVEAQSIQGAITKLARSQGGGWRKDYGDSEMTRYNLRGACVCAFVQWADEEILANYPAAIAI